MLATDRSPWPEGHGDVVFVLDTRNRVEHGLLERWVTETAPPGARVPAVARVDLGTARDAERGTLDAVAGSGPATTVVPLRIVWSAGGAKRPGPRLRDLAFGDPRNPRPWMARIVLLRHPEPARHVAAEPATLDELRAR